MNKLTESIPGLYDDRHFQTYRRLPVTFIKGKGVYLYDSEGRRYLDALAGIAVNNVGHCHPKVVKAIRQQAKTLMHVSNLYHNIPQGILAKVLTEVTEFDRVFFCNSGLEANEGALKICRKFGEIKGRKGPIAYFSGSFHGRSIATIAMGKPAYQQNFGPLPGGFLELPYNDLTGLEKLDDDTKAVFVECVQGEGGVIPGERKFLEALGACCIEKEILLVVDEVQTGVGRTGKMLSFQHHNLNPDVVTMAKGLGGGMPIGAILANENVASILQFGDHGSTFGGNPLACASALASIQAVLDEKLSENARKTGDLLLNRITALSESYPFVVSVRGLGLMIGIEFADPCRDVALKLLQKGLLVSCTAQNVIRLVPPLIISRRQVNEIMTIVTELFEEMQHLPSEN
jgi:acetylornithine/N-succinyldiaminopimelate aminotransferase